MIVECMCDVIEVYMKRNWFLCNLSHCVLVFTIRLAKLCVAVFEFHFRKACHKMSQKDGKTDGTRKLKTKMLNSLTFVFKIDLINNYFLYETFFNAMKISKTQKMTKTLQHDIKTTSGHAFVQFFSDLTSGIRYQTTKTSSFHPFPLCE